MTAYLDPFEIFDEGPEDGQPDTDLEFLQVVSELRALHSGEADCS
jgi:hypothetical protein